MRVAALYDIHGNLPALEAVLADISTARADQIVVGGDLVPGPMPRDCLHRLRALDLPVQFIVGNGEVAVLAELEGRDPGVPAQYREAMRWNAAQLHPSDEQSLKTWPRTLAIEINGIGRVLFCHATPQSADQIFTRLTPEDKLLPIFAGCDADVVVCGHTHMQFDRRVGRLQVLNAGSIGMPFGAPGAYWLLLGPRLEFRRTDYDLTMAAARIRATQYPGADEFARQNILSPPSEEKMLAAFGAT
jgi:putative phosphoesterase